MRIANLLLLLLIMTGCRTATVEYFWSEKVFTEIQCFRTVYIEQRESQSIFETDPEFTKALRKAARGRSLGFHFVDSIDRADVVIGVVKNPKVVTTHAETTVDTTWAMDVASRQEAMRAPSGELSARVMVTGEVGFGVSIPKQVIDALEHVHDQTCNE